MNKKTAKQITARFCRLATRASRIGGVAAVVLVAANAQAMPTVDGDMISWPDDGWYQVQSSGTYESFCEGGTSCTVSPGTYIVINHSTGERFEGVIVEDGTGGVSVRVDGDTISWSDDGWYQVQSAVTYESFCEGGTSCTVAPGTYIVINHTTGERYEDVLVEDDTGGASVSVDGDTISWPDDGWYQVQSAGTYESFCEGDTSCTVAPGTYIVINHTTGQRFEGIEVGDGTTGPVAGRARGQLVAPEGPDSVAVGERMLYGLDALLRQSDCPGVPAGYQPLADAQVQFLDAVDLAVGDSFVTDECGFFDVAVPEGAETVRATTSDFRDIVTELSTFQQDDGAAGLASTIPDTADYQIGSLQRIDAQRVGFTVTDTESNQAVLGIPDEAFSLLVDNQDAAFSDIQLSSLTPDSATTALVLDASGSMETAAFQDPDTLEQFSRLQLANLAGHVFLDQKGDSDEVAITLFDDTIAAIDGTNLNDLFSFQTGDGQSAPQPLSDSGFETDAANLRVIVDAYDFSSELYPGGSDSLHPDTPSDLIVTTAYPFGGATAAYDAVIDGVSRADERQGSRPFVLAMTDGADNRSAATLQEAIDAAVAASVPVYTVGFGQGVNRTALESLADQTGASYFQVDDTDIGDAFQSIQTGILFQYIGTLSDIDTDIGETTAITLRLDYNGLQVERSFTPGVPAAVN